MTVKDCDYEEPIELSDYGGGYSSAPIQSSRIFNRNVEITTIERAQLSLFENLPGCDLGDINIYGSPRNVHLGTEIVLNGPVYITSLTRLDIMTIQENCRCCAKKKMRKIQEREDKSASVIKFIKKTKRNWNLRKCLMFAVLVTFMEILIFYSLYKSASRDDLPDFSKSISSKQIKKMHTSLKNLFKERSTDSSAPNNCTYQCLTSFTKIIFDVPNESVLSFNSSVPANATEKNSNSSLPSDVTEESYDYSEPKKVPKERPETSNDDDKFIEKILSTKNPSYNGTQLNDIYYNYIIDKRGTIFGGRDLTCPFDEKFSEDHNTTLVIGIVSCFQNNNTSDGLINKVIDSVHKLLFHLNETGLFKTMYKVRFPKVCEGTTFVTRLKSREDFKTVYFR